MARFTSNQVKFIDWLAQGKYDRSPPSQGELAKKLGVTDVTLSRWKQGQNGFTRQEFWDEVVKRARELNGEALPDVHNSLREEAIKGSYQHQKLLFEMTGEYVPKKEIDHRIVDVTTLSDSELEAIIKAEGTS